MGCQVCCILFFVLFLYFGGLTMNTQSWNAELTIRTASSSLTFAEPSFFAEPWVFIDQIGWSLLCMNLPSRVGDESRGAEPMDRSILMLTQTTFSKARML